MNNRCFIILSILVIGCYSVPVQRARRQPDETATEVSEEKELSLEKSDESSDSENKDKQESVIVAEEAVNPDNEKVGDSEESQEIEEKKEEPVAESRDGKVDEADKESSDEDEKVVEPKGVEELYQESKAEFEKREKMPEAAVEEISEDKAEEEKEKESGAKTVPAANDEELRFATGDVAPAANGGMFSGFSQLWQTMTTLGSSWEHWTRIFNAFTAMAGFR